MKKVNYSEMKDYELYQLVLQGDEEAIIAYSGMAMKSGDLEEAMNILGRIDEAECDIELAKKKYELLGDGWGKPNHAGLHNKRG